MHMNYVFHIFLRCRYFSFSHITKLTVNASVTKVKKNKNNSKCILLNGIYGISIIVLTTFIPYNVTKADSIYTWSNICLELLASVIAFSQCLHPVYKIDCFVNVHFVSSYLRRNHFMYIFTKFSSKR